MMRVAIIPARGGSKRIPGKNIKLFCGKPMIAWSIEAALKSKCFDRVIVSTDDADIAAVAREWGAETPFYRPATLSDDFASTRAVMIHALQWIEANNSSIDIACCLYATAPFVTADKLRMALRILEESSAQFCFTVVKYSYPIQRALKLVDGRVEMFNPELRSARSQDLEASYHDAGQFYLGYRDAFINDLPTFSKHSTPLIVPHTEAQDIDEPEDWVLAKILFENQRMRETER